MLSVQVGDRRIGGQAPCFVIAEAGVNHNGDVDIACRLVEAAAHAGADAVKFQTFHAERLVSRDAPKAEYQLSSTDPTQSQFDMIRQLELSDEDFRRVQQHCVAHNIMFLSSPFDEASADFLEQLGVETFKIPSGEITNLPLLAHIARKGKPMIVSTGMSSLGEVEAALDVVSRNGGPACVLLHCVSNYPARVEDVNLRVMSTLASAFGIPVGYSDHTIGVEVPLAAVALGACVIEKHFTLDRTMLGPDHQASAEPAELASLVRGIRAVGAALGDGRKTPAVTESNTAMVARKSLAAARDILAGSVLSPDALTVIRPGTGLPPMVLPYIVGRTLRVTVHAGELICLEMLQ